MAVSQTLEILQFGEKEGITTLEVSHISPHEPEVGLLFNHFLLLENVKLRRLLAAVRCVLIDTMNGSGGCGGKALAMILMRMSGPLIPLVFFSGAKIASASMERKKHKCLFFFH